MPDRKCPGTVEIRDLPWYPYLASLEDKATQRCDLSAGWLSRGGCHTVSLLSVEEPMRYRWLSP